MRNVLTVFNTMLLVVLSVTAFSVSPVTAQVFFSDDEAEFLVRNPNLALQDFESGMVPPVNLTVCSVLVNGNTNDDCFVPGDILPGIEFMATEGPMAIFGPGTINNPFIVLTALDGGADFSIMFPGNTVNVAGVDLGCFTGVGNPPCDVTVNVFGPNGNLIGSTIVTASNMVDAFLGVESVLPISRIEVAEGTDDAGRSIDRVLFGFAEVEPREIPTLSEWGMIAAAGGLMMVGVFFAVRRKRLQASA